MPENRFETTLNRLDSGACIKSLKYKEVLVVFNLKVYFFLTDPQSQTFYRKVVTLIIDHFNLKQNLEVRCN